MELMSIVEVARQVWVVWLMLIFLGIVFWAMRPSNKSRFEDDAMIIFKNGNNGENGGHAHG
ncbi:MAG: cbb3-type cytochrome c oxidase subunit 3 [Alphaproteobacteria bacterium]|nr:cbb3-type cytochrome c oxidase subunit 3 [Alphaproteobacteria bacterium]